MMIKKLNFSTLKNCATDVILPRYNPEQHASGIVHIGIGAFHKAHQAVYTDDVLNKFGGDWRITAVSLRNPGARDQLAPQNYLYSLVEKSDAAITYRIIAAVEKVLVAPENPAAVIALLAQSSIKIVSLTITEKGYCQTKGALELHNLQIQHDLKNPATPTTMHGFLVAACAQRKQNNQCGFTVISCDNLAHNGNITRAVVLAFAAEWDASLANWISDNVTFCSTMVDRIVPATCAPDIQDASQHIGMEDQATVISEPFRQWVIEDNFCTARPPWEEVGALIVKDVIPFENMKLRLLNGSHSVLAYLGFLAGHTYIHEALADPAMHLLIENFMDHEVTPTLQVPEGFTLELYKKEIRTRFSNSLVRYKTTQVASDGSQKLLQRWLNTAVELIQLGYRPKIIPFVLAAWFRYLTGVDEGGNVFEVVDPKSHLLTPLACNTLPASHSDEMQRVKALAKATDIFPAALIANESFMKDIAYWLTKINTQGIRFSIKQCLNI